MATNLYESSSFTNSPADILYLIFDLLSPADHHALCLVNHQCRSIAERSLYSKVHWNWQQGRETPKSPPGPPPITQILRTLIARPQLASYITDLHMEGTAYWRHEYRRVFATIPVPGPDELDGLASAIRRTRVSFCDTWIDEVSRGSIDGLVALLLSQVPNLRSLHLEGDFTRQTALIGLVLRAAICEQPAGRYALPTFQNLREVSFLIWETEDEARDDRIKNTADILPLLYLSNLDRLSAVIQNPPVQFTWPAASPPAPSKLTSLHLKILHQSYLGDLLAITPNITSLCWEWYYDLCVEDSIMINSMDMDLAPIPRALYPVRDTLTNLVIRPWSAIGGNEQFDPTIKPSGSLRGLVDFHRIRTLQAPWELLVGFTQDTSRRLQDSMPRNVEVVTLTDDLALQNCGRHDRAWPAWEWEDWARLQVVEEWFREWRACTPCLRRVVLRLEYADYDLDQWEPEARERLREVGARFGVSVDIVCV